MLLLLLALNQANADCFFLKFNLTSFDTCFYLTYFKLFHRLFYILLLSLKNVPRPICALFFLFFFHDPRYSVPEGDA